MRPVELRNDQWSKIRKFLRSCPDVYVGNSAQCRRFVEAVLWMARSGAQWRLLPEPYGNWNTVYKRFARWCEKGIWERMHHHFADDPDMENIIIDSTIVRAHPCAAGASAKKGGQASQSLGRSRGGFSTKVHVSVDGLGNPLRFILTGRQSHDITQGPALIAGYTFDQAIGDRGYDSDDFRREVLESGGFSVIPPRAKRKEARPYDKCLYRERHLVECFINKIKHYRRIFSRFEKLGRSYMGFLHFVGTLIWLR